MIAFIRSKRLQHAPYSPYCAQMDFVVYPRLIGDLRGKRLDNMDELRVAIRPRLAMYEKTWFADVFNKWLTVDALNIIGSALRRYDTDAIISLC